MKSLLSIYAQNMKFLSIPPPFRHSYQMKYLPEAVTTLTNTKTDAIITFFNSKKNKANKQKKMPLCFKKVLLM